MTEPTDQGGTPPPDENHDDTTSPPPAPPPPPPPAPSEWDAFDAREALFTGALQNADRLANAAEAVRLQVMLAGFDAMVLEEEAQTGRPVRPDDAVVRAFLLHQASTLHVTWGSVDRRLQLGRSLRDRLPQTWAVFLTGLASERAVDAAAECADRLTGPALTEYDTTAAALVQEARVGTIERQLGLLRDRLDPEGTTERHKTATTRRTVGASPEGDGQGVLHVHATAIDTAAAYDAIRQAAVAAHGREGECRTLGQLMSDIAIDLILHGAATDAADLADPAYPMERIGSLKVPHRKAVTATILVPVPAATATGAGNEPAEVAGMGSVDAEVARQLVAHTMTWTRVGVDPIDDSVFAIDSHERYIPAGLKKLLHIRSRTCAGDDCGLPAHRGDIDHVTRFEHDGRTRHDNLQILCRRSHHAKDSDYCDVRMLTDGNVEWRNKWGGRRIVKPAIKVKTRVKATTSTYPEECPF